MLHLARSAQQTGLCSTVFKEDFWLHGSAETVARRGLETWEPGFLQPHGCLCVQLCLQGAHRNPQRSTLSRVQEESHPLYTRSRAGRASPRQGYLPAAPSSVFPPTEVEVWWLQGSWMTSLLLSTSAGRQHQKIMTAFLATLLCKSYVKGAWSLSVQTLESSPVLPQAGLVQLCC